MPEFQCSAVLFDLDGVLVDSTESVIQVWTAWSKQNGIEPSKTLAMIHGRRTMEALQLLAPYLDIKSEAEKIEAGITHKKGGTVAIAGAANLLRSLPPDRWCVVTSGLREFAKIRLRDAGLPVPVVLVSAEDVTNGKPHPEPYLKGAELLKAKPTDCLVFEDALNGIQSARAAGMKAVGITTTYSAAELQAADVVIPAFSQVHVMVDPSVLRIRM